MVSAVIVNPGECGFEQCVVDPCVFRLMVAGDVVAMMVFHVDDSKIATTEEGLKWQSVPSTRGFPPNI